MEKASKLSPTNWITGLLQFRTLDWDMSGPFRDYPHITVYHPNEGNAFANVGWTGWVGSLTGMNDQQMAISEIGASYADEVRLTFFVNKKFAF